MYKVVFAKRTLKDKGLLKAAGLERKVKKLLDMLADNPYQAPPAYEKLKGDLAGLYSRRINIRHRIVYEVREPERTVIIRAMWTHYDS